MSCAFPIEERLQGCALLLEYDEAALLERFGELREVRQHSAR
jgi:hypothetical protein